MSGANTVGKIIGQPSTPKVAAAAANPPAEEPNVLEKAQQGTKNAIDNWVEGTGYNQGAMVAGAVATAVVEVFMPTAWWELIPVGKGAKILKKGAQVTGLLKKGEHVAEAAVDANKLKKAEEEALRLKKAEEEAARTKKLEEEAAEAKKAQEEAAKNNNGGKIKKNTSGEKGKCGEWLSKMDMVHDGFDEVIEVQNNSGHGVDLIGRNSKTGEVKVWEVKTTDTEKASDLSKAQKKLGGEGFVKDRLERAAAGKGNYGKIPKAMENAEKAQEWIERSKGKVVYEKREVFIDDLEKGCAKHPKRPSASKPWKV